MKTRTTQSINVRRASSYPAHTPVGLPALSPTMEKGNLKSWEKEEGAKLEEGDLLATVETDKATMDFETPQEGYLAKILMPEGSQEVPLGKLVCIIVENEEDVAAFKNYTHEDSESASASTSSAETQPASQPSGAKQPEAEPATSANYPEHEVVKLPALSPTVESSTLKEWAKKVGDKIEEGDVIANVETDKATIEWTYEDTDVKYLAKILIPEGTSDIAVGAPVCVFVESPEHIGSFKDFTASAAPKTATPVPPAPAAPASKPDVPAKPAPSQTQAPKAGGRVFATPFAKTVAKKKGVDISVSFN